MITTLGCRGAATAGTADSSRPAATRIRVDATMAPPLEPVKSTPRIRLLDRTPVRAFNMQGEETSLFEEPIRGRRGRRGRKWFSYDVPVDPSKPLEGGVTRMPLPWLTSGRGDRPRR
jgi:hypothetical protein